MDENKYEIIFINDSGTPLLSAAYDAVAAYDNLCSKRLDAMEVMTRYLEKPPKRISFVLCRFEGECFEHLRSIGAAIYGPQIILHYVRENKALPKVSYPLYSTALAETVATITSVTGAKREYLLNSIRMLHGQASRDLTDEVNVVITPKVGSKKYLVGASRGLHILLPSWIEEAWKLSAIQDPIDMMIPSQTERFRVPIFSELLICVSGFSVEERHEVSDLVLKHGGQYSGMMKVGKTTHLIVKQAVGTKYLFAKKWKIQIVNVRWLVDSVNKGYALDEVDYRIDEGTESSSTPICNVNKRTIAFDNISVISHVSTAPTRVDETNNDFPLTGSIRQSESALCIPNILSGCSVSLLNCSKEEVITYSHLIEKLGGCLYTKLHDKVSENLTHVIVGISTSILNLQNRDPEVMYVQGLWLNACEEACSKLPETDFLVPFETPCEEQNLVTRPECERSPQTVDNEDLKLINQYFGSEGLADFDDFSAKVIDVDIPSKRASPNHTVNSEVTITSDGIFTNATFFLHEELQLESMTNTHESIICAGGNIVQSSSRVNFIVAPFFVKYLPEHLSVCRIVTPSWIDHCIKSSRISLEYLDEEPAFVPKIRCGVPPLNGCVISLSGFVGNDRNLLTTYAQSLGAIVQECFLRKAVPSRHLFAITHLIAAKPDGRKWPAAKSWGLHAVSRSWLYACAENWCRVCETDFAVQDENPTIQQASIVDIPKEAQLVILEQPNRILQDIRLQSNVLKNSPIEVAGKSSPDPVPSKTISSHGDSLRTPEWVNERVSTINKNNSRESINCIRKVSPPLSEQVAHCLKKAVFKTESLPKRKLNLSDEESDTLTLKSVVICVAKHLSSRQVELNGVIKQLGGDFKWTYDPQVCTHIITEYCANERDSSVLDNQKYTPRGHSSKSFMQYEDVSSARSDGKFIVTPLWLTGCLAASRRLPESDFSVGSTALYPNVVTPIDACQRSRKIRRVESSDLLGDVNRRLGTMLCDKSNEPAVDDPYRQASVSITMDSPTSRSSGYNEVITTRTEVSRDGPDPFPKNKPGSRRLRRNPLCGPNVSHENAAGLVISDQADGCNTVEPHLSVDGTVDRAQPGQSLMVRWQYEDAPPRSPSTEVEFSKDDTPKVLINKSSITGSGQDGPYPPPMPLNPGQSIVGIESITVRDRVTSRSNPTANEMGVPIDALLPNPTSVPGSQPTQQQRDESDEDVNKLSEVVQHRRVISFSGIVSDERDHYASVVTQLGGEVDLQLTINNLTTHLIVHTPARSEKYLICLAAGKWILHKSYLDACNRELRWLDESSFEWGGPGTQPLLMQLSSVECTAPWPTNKGIPKQQSQSGQLCELAKSARHWRMMGGNAFQNWRVIFGPGCDKETSFRRVIEAGGGQVLATGPPYPSPSVVTHSFYQRRSDFTFAMKQLPTEYQWLRIDYLLAYLTTRREVPKAEFAINTIE